MFKEYHFDSWEEFKFLYHDRLNISKKDSNIETRYIFRGQGDSSWKLISSFERVYSKLEYEKLLKFFWEEFEDPVTANQFPEQKFIFDEIRSSSFYKNRDEETDKNKDKDENNKTIPIEIVALGQHYGLPTKLLDWTESPYIAAFFAFSEAILLLSNSSVNEIKADEKEVVIWALENSDEWKNKGLEIHKPKSDGNLRLYQQKGYLTQFTKDNCSVSSIEELMKSEDTPIAIKFCIPASQSAGAVKDLSLMGIDSTKMFGDLEGRARSALNKAIIENLKLGSFI